MRSIKFHYKIYIQITNSLTLHKKKQLCDSSTLQFIITLNNGNNYLLLLDFNKYKKPISQPQQNHSLKFNFSNFIITSESRNKYNRKDFNNFVPDF